MNKNEQLKIPNERKIKKFSLLTTSIRSGLSRRLSLVDIGLPVINPGILILQKSNKLKLLKQSISNDLLSGAKN